MATWEAQAKEKGPRTRCPLGNVVLRSDAGYPSNTKERLFSFAFTSSRDLEPGLRPDGAVHPGYCSYGWVRGADGWNGDAPWKQNSLTSLDAVPSTLLRSLCWRRNASGERKRMRTGIAASGFLFFC